MNLTVSIYVKNCCTVNSVSIFSPSITQTVPSRLALKKKKQTSVERDIRAPTAASRSHGPCCSRSRLVGLTRYDRYRISTGKARLVRDTDVDIKRSLFSLKTNRYVAAANVINRSRTPIFWIRQRFFFKCGYSITKNMSIERQFFFWSR